MLRPRNRFPHAQRTLGAALLAAALALGSASAQNASPSLTDVLPATTVAVFHAAPSPVGFDVFHDILEMLDVDAVLQTLAALGADVADGDFSAPDMGSLLDELVAGMALECPEIADSWSSDALEGLMGPAILAVSVSPFNPIPAGIGVARPSDEAAAARFQDALVSCFGEGLVLREGDVELHVVGDGSDLPLVLARFGGLFVVSTNPDLARAAVRLAQGSDEPRHVDGAIGREAAALIDSGIGFTLDFVALADALEGLRGMLPAEEAGAVFDRLLATLRTVGGVAARVTTDSTGVRFDSVTTVDPLAGDVALARLLACETCRPGLPTLIPAGVASLNARVFAPMDFVAWLDDWLNVVGRMIGEPLDLRMLASDTLDLDLDAALLDWVGNTWHMAQVDVLGTDLRGWLVGPGTITTVPVTSEDAARSGIDIWRDLLRDAPALVEALTAGVPGADMAFGDARDGAVDLLSVRSMEYRGVPYERWRFGPTVDVGLLVLDGHLVIGSPASVLRGVIDVHNGAPTVAADPVLGDALARLPATATGYGVADVARGVRGIAALSDVLAGPIATLAVVTITERDADDDWDSWEDFDYDGLSGGQITGTNRSTSRFGTEPRTDPAADIDTLDVPGSVDAEITDGDALSSGDLGLVYELVGLRTGDLVEIEMLDPSGSTFDTYLYLFDLGAGVVVADNDDAPTWSRSEIVFEVAPDVRYAVIAGSFGGTELGAFVINTRVLAAANPDDDMDAAADAEPRDDTGEMLDDEALGDDAPARVDVSFDQVVGLVDFVTAFLEALADRTGVAFGSTETVDGVTRSTLSIPLR
ncbi:MAG: hypothetical protein H0U69_08180 [Trueperaceae bacterium]|nr:hypothetical protein [Trueperaceae bacterium]